MLINAIIILAIIYILSMRMILLKRFADFFYIFAMFLIPDIIRIFNKKEERILLSFIIVGALISYFYIITIKANLHGVLPYQVFF